jgi:molybdopterin-containing oxidoreductase family iron-sulfur binding subunit
LENEIGSSYGVEATIRDPQPLDGVVYGYALNIGRCIGCRKCVYGCMKENNLSRNPQVQYIRVLKMKKEGQGIDLETSIHDYPQEEAGDPNYYYMPVQCQQCSSPPCVKVCPVKATWQEMDGIVVVDYNWCIGCRYCEAACPYHARRFNFAKPRVSSEELNPDMAYLSNRPRYMGVMEKCTFCLQRTRTGRYPACAEVCPTGTRKFGNLNDPDSEVRKIIERERVYVLKQDLGTIPKFYYVFAK